jgi:uncharacterized protein YajQ (UPF0234 family)
MPSFDVVCELNMHELDNALDQSNREIGTRFDFKGVKASFTVSEKVVTLKAENEFQLQQMMDVFRKKLTKRGIDLAHLEVVDPVIGNQSASQEVKMQQGIKPEIAKKIVKFIKDSKLKLQAAIQGDLVRISGAKKDDLQSTISLLRKENFGLPLQFNNFRD